MEINRVNVEQALNARKSVRAFLDQNVDHNLILQILDAARMAPSGTNTQPWKVAVVSGSKKQELDKKLEKAFWDKTPKQMDYNYYPIEFTGEYKRRRVECGMALYGALHISKEDKEAGLKQWSKNYSAFGAPVTLYFFADHILEKGSFMDYGMFLQSIMLMATSLGLATCPQAALAEYPQIIRDSLDYGDDQILLCGLALGYEDPTAPVNNYRTSRDAVSTFTRFFD